MTTAAVIIVGDELLTGKVRDSNGPQLVSLLREQGVTLVRVAYVADGVEDIADEVGRCATRHDAVVTSGGLGPTHDDRTVEGVARGLGVPVVRHGALEAMVRTLWGERVNDAALRLADVPAGARLLAGGDGLLPVVVVRNVYLLPGLPRLFTAKLASLRGELRGRRRTLRNLYLQCDEFAVAATLARVAAESPTVSVGSYPRLDEPGHQVWVTVEGTDPQAVERSLARLLELLPPEYVLRAE